MIKLSKDKISVALVRKSWTTQRLAKASHLCLATVIRAIHEKDIRLTTANKICKALDTDIQELIKS